MSASEGAASALPPSTVIVCLADYRAYPPLVRLINALSEQGAPVAFVHWAKPAMDKMTAELHSKVETTEVLVSNNRYRRVIQSVGFFFRTAFLILDQGAQSIIIVDPVSRMHGFLLSCIFSAATTYIEYDEVPVPTSWRMFLREWAMQRLALKLRAVLIPNETRAKSFAKRYRPSCPIELLPNHPSLTEFACESDLVSYRLGEPLRLYFHGSFVKERMPLSLIKVLVDMRNVQLVIKPVIPDIRNGDSYLNDFLGEAQLKGVRSRIEMVPGASLKELKSIARTCHVGIAFYAGSEASDVNLGTMWGASNKIGQYAAYGLAILCSSSEPEMNKNLDGYASFCEMDRAHSIVHALTGMLKSPDDFNRRRRELMQHARENWTLEAAVAQPGVRIALGLNHLRMA